MHLLHGQGLLPSPPLFLSFSYGIVCMFELQHLIFSDEIGDRPRPFPVIKELKNATDITERKGDAAWDYDVSFLADLF